jgi:transposase-like protein
MYSKKCFRQRAMTKQNPTDPDISKWELSPQQETAVDLLSVGKSITEVAKEVGVSRQTISQWRNGHAGFQAAFNQRRHELWEAVSERLRTLLPAALDVVERAIANGDLKAALSVLKAVGLHDLAPPDGPIHPQDVESKIKEEEAVRNERGLFATLR